MAIILILQLAERRARYKEPKTIQATRAETFQEVTLIVGEAGLVGFMA